MHLSSLKYTHIIQLLLKIDFEILSFVAVKRLPHLFTFLIELIPLLLMILKVLHHSLLSSLLQSLIQGCPPRLKHHPTSFLLLILFLNNRTTKAIISKSTRNIKPKILLESFSPAGAERVAVSSDLSGFDLVYHLLQLLVSQLNRPDLVLFWAFLVNLDELLKGLTLNLAFTNGCKGYLGMLASLMGCLNTVMLRRMPSQG